MGNFFRLLGAAFILGGVVAFGYEIALMVQLGSYRMMSFGQLWAIAHRPSMDLLRNVLDTGTWNVLLVTYLAWPGWAALAGPGMVLMVLGLRRRRGDTLLQELPGR